MQPAGLIGLRNAAALDTLGDPAIEILRADTQAVAEARGGEVPARNRSVDGASREAADARDLFGRKQFGRPRPIGSRSHVSTESQRLLFANDSERSARRMATTLPHSAVPAI